MVVPPASRCRTALSGTVVLLALAAGLPILFIHMQQVRAVGFQIAGYLIVRNRWQFGTRNMRGVSALGHMAVALQAITTATRFWPSGCRDPVR